MAKYRALTATELNEFEKEFIDYLVVNGITADEWVRLKAEEKAKAEKIIELFSDVILEGVLRKIKFLHIKTKNYVQTIQCLPNKIIMVAVSVTDKSIDLTQFDAVSFNALDAAKFELHSGEKKYTKNREADLFALTEKGYVVSDGTLFKQLILATVA